MNNIKVAAATLNQTPLDWEGNKNRILEKIEKAKDQGVNFLCLPELCITGYGCEDAFFYDFVTEKALNIAHEIAEEVDEMVVAVGLPVNIGNVIYNCIAVLQFGEIIGIVPKQNLSSDGVHYEKRWFKAWPANHASKLLFGKDIIPIGDLIFSFGDVRLGFEICEDAWVIDRPGNSLAKRGANLIFNPSASHFAFDKTKIRESFIKEGSRAFNCVYVYSNLIGNESGRIIFDGDCFIAQNGKILSHFNMLDDVFSYVVDINSSITKQIQSASFKSDLNHGEILDFDQFWNEDQEFSQTRLPYHSNIETKFEQFEAITTLGLYDYMRKSKSSGYVVSLSGGIDSTVCALLIYLMCFEYKLNTKEILTCVYQKTKNSSKETEQAAEELAKTIGASYACIDVDSFVNEYTNLTEQIIGRTLTWEKDDIALQNIQARVRSPSVWMVANIKNAILLSTSNRSEAAVGYATLDGDTSGGLAPIAGVDKQFLIEWINHSANQTSSSFYKPVREALNLVLSIKPTAELRPAEKSQTDEKDLMPYVVLDKIERLAIHDKKSPKDVLKYLTHELWVNYSKEELYSYVKKFFQLWARNQYKRERYAVSFHLDDANLDPRSWCRFPVLNSGFEEELSEL